jgi:hypothetical protein
MAGPDMNDHIFRLQMVLGSFSKAHSGTKDADLRANLGGTQPLAGLGPAPRCVRKAQQCGEVPKDRFGSTSARRPRGEARRRRAGRSAARRRRSDPTRSAAVKNLDTSGATGPTKTDGRRGVRAGRAHPSLGWLLVLTSGFFTLELGRTDGPPARFL